MPDISALERVMSPVKGMGMTVVSAGSGVVDGVSVGWTVSGAVGEMTASCSGSSVGWGAGEAGRQPAV